MTRKLRQDVGRRAKGRCEYCCIPQELVSNPFQLDHVRAEKHRGVTELDNLAWACFRCNSYKGSNVAGYDPLTQTLQALFNPRSDDWNEHFSWSGPLLLGLTAVGRTTIDVLRINLDERVSHRQLLIRAGLFFIN